MVEAVIFDIDGTLIDSVDLHAEAWVETFKQFGRSVEFKSVRAKIGEGADRLIPELLGDETPKAVREEIANFRAKLFTEKYLKNVKPFPCVRELFEKLRAQGQLTVLGSSCRASEIEHYKAIANISDVVDAQATSDDADCSKPSPQIFNAAMTAAGKNKEQVIVVGDTIFDIQAAAKAGVRAIGVLCGGASHHELLKAGAIAVYDNPAHLLERYDDSPLSRR